MSFDSIEKSTAGARPYELFLFEGTGIDVALTSGDETVSYLGRDYLPSTISRTEVDQSSEVNSGEIKVYMPAEHPVAQLFVGYLPTSPVALTIFAGHRGDSVIAVVFSGSVSSSRFTDEAELTCNGDQYRLQRQIPQQLYQAPCVHIFGDADCGVDLGSVTYPGTVTAIDPTGTVVTVSGFGSLPHSLKAGYIRVGNALRMILDQAGAVITLSSPIPGLAVTAVVAGTAGCQNTFASCQEYNNIANFLGFDLIPKLNPFDGSVT